MLTITFYKKQKKEEFVYTMGDDKVYREIGRILYDFAEKEKIEGKKVSLKDDALLDTLTCVYDYNKTMFGYYGYSVMDEDYEENYYTLICNELKRLMSCCYAFDQFIIKDSGRFQALKNFLTATDNILDSSLSSEEKALAILSVAKQERKTLTRKTKGKGF